MATTSFDVVTILRAMAVLQNGLKSSEWVVCNAEQEQLVQWLTDFGPQLGQLSLGEFHVADNSQELNDFQLTHGYQPCFNTFVSGHEAGIATGLQVLIHPLSAAMERVTVSTPKGNVMGFDMPIDDVSVFELDGYNWARLVMCKMEGDITMWFLSPNADQQMFSSTTLGLVETAMTAMAARRSDPMTIVARFPVGAIRPMHNVFRVPLAKIEHQPSLGVLAGLSLKAGKQQWVVSQFHQELKLRFNDRDAKPKNSVLPRLWQGGNNEPRPLILNKPFFVWFTQPGLDIPQATTVIEYDVMKFV